MKTTIIDDVTWKENGLPVPEKEYRFHSIRRWRFDFAFVREKLAIEIDGGIWTFGRHSRGKGIIRDQEKANTAIEMGWRILKYTPKTIDFEQVKRIYERTSD